MTAKTKLSILAFIVGLPALVMLANLVMFAFVGQGFLPEGNPDMNAARGAVTWFSATGAVMVAMMGMTT